MLGLWIYKVFEHTRVLNIPRLWICFWFRPSLICLTRFLNMSGLHRVLNMLVNMSAYAYIYLSMTEHVWIYLHQPKWLFFSKRTIDCFLEETKFEFFYSSSEYLIFFCFRLNIFYFFLLQRTYSEIHKCCNSVILWDCKRKLKII